MTTADESALLAAIRANPADDAPRLIYADWLEENGESVHAELIRVQCELARIPRWEYAECKACIALIGTVMLFPTGRGCCVLDEYGGGSEGADETGKYKSLRTRERKLLSAIMDNLPDGCRIDDGRPSNSILVKFTRGFVSHVTADLSTLVGGQCAQCHGFGVVRLPINHSGYMRCTSAECDYCLGTGRINGTLPKIVRSRCAVIERVIASDVTYQYDDQGIVTVHLPLGINSIMTIGQQSRDEDIAALSDHLIRWAWSVDPEASNVDAAR